jgi:predicted peptidase
MAISRRALAMALVMATIPAVLAVGDGLQPEPGEQIETTVAIETTDATPKQVDVPLLLYTPKDYKPDSDSYPLVIFLHGRGESGPGGQELKRVTKHGPPKQVADGKALPFVLVSPQCPAPTGFGQVGGAWRPEVLLPLVDQIEEELNIDADRIYLTGLSMGGFGSWRVVAAAPERFAAVVPICGGGNPSSIPSEIKGTPIWAFHGDKDNVVPLAGTVSMVDAVNKAGGSARLTVYPGVGHDSWTQTYDNPMFYDWLLALKRGGANE